MLEFQGVSHFQGLGILIFNGMCTLTTLGIGGWIQSLLNVKDPVALLIHSQLTKHSHTYYVT
jgi:hypothetical protein